MLHGVCRYRACGTGTGVALSLRGGGNALGEWLCYVCERRLPGVPGGICRKCHALEMCREMSDDDDNDDALSDYPPTSELMWKFRAYTLMAGKFIMLYRRASERVNAPGGAGFSAARDEFGQLSAMLGSSVRQRHAALATAACAATHATHPRSTAAWPPRP